MSFCMATRGRRGDRSLYFGRAMVYHQPQCILTMTAASGLRSGWLSCVEERSRQEEPGAPWALGRA